MKKQIILAIRVALVIGSLAGYGLTKSYWWFLGIPLAALTWLFD